MAFEIYVTDALGTICNNTARQCGGAILNKRYYDFIKDEPDEPQRTSEDIIKSVTESINCLGKEEDDVSL